MSFGVVGTPVNSGSNGCLVAYGVIVIAYAIFAFVFHAYSLL